MGGTDTTHRVRDPRGTATGGLDAVEAVIRGHVEGRGLPGALAGAVLYAGLGPGKRVRPTVALRAYGAVAGGDGSGDAGRHAAAFRAAAAVEMVHAFSLVHDDLPAMDDDDLRRGRPTLHRHAGEALAILGGDALLSMAFEVVAGVDDAALAAALTGELAAATTDMIAGQVYDTLPGAVDNDLAGGLQASGGVSGGASGGAAGVNPSALSALTRTHRLKTGALLRAAARMGGRCAGADADQLEALTRYADATGLMFQVVDDLLDVTSDAATLGKATQKDGAAGKVTYPGLLGVDGARAEVARLLGEALGELTAFGPAADPLRALAVHLAERER